MGIEVTRGGLPLGRNQRQHKTGSSQYSRHRAANFSLEIFLTCQLVTRNLLATRGNWSVLNGDVCRNHVSSLLCGCHTRSHKYDSIDRKIEILSKTIRRAMRFIEYFRVSSVPMNSLRHDFLVRCLSLAWVLLFVALLGGCSSSSEKNHKAPREGAAIETDGHQKMKALLKHIAEHEGKDNLYLGAGSAEQLRSEIESSPADNSDEIQKLKVRLAEAVIRLGNAEEAIQLLEGVHENMQQYSSSMPDLFRNYVRFKLGLASLRLGEIQNCCEKHTPESCIYPIKGSGLHTREEGSRKAIHYFTEVLEHPGSDDSLHKTAMWLLNIAYMTLGEHPDGVPAAHLITLFPDESEVDFPAFENVATALGLDTVDLSGGAIVDDFDNDGDLDIVSSTFDIKGNMHMFRNNADGTFTECTKAAGLEGLLGGLNMVQADFNNDGFVDIFVLRGGWFGKKGTHPNSLLKNLGDGTFIDITFESGLGESHSPTQTASWADFDNDGDLDLYIGNEQTDPTRRFPCQLFRNNGDETFTDIAAESGVENFGFTKGVIWGDYDNDRFPDLYVSNAGHPNRLYHNNGDGTFSDVASEAGVTQPIDSFPAWFWDYNNDGNLDIYASSYRWESGVVSQVVSSYQGQPFSMNPPRLFQGNGEGQFTDVAADTGVHKLSLPMGSNFGDINGDGFLDFYLGTGYPDYEALTPNAMYLNRDGRSFTDITAAGRFGHLQKGHGIAFADLDNDGDQDVFEQMGGAYLGDKFGNALYRNPGFGNRWIAIQLVGTQSNRSGIGARIHVVISEGAKTRSIYKHVNSGGSFGANPLRQYIGLGNADKIERLEIYWPTSDTTQIFHNVPMDRFIRIQENADQYKILKLKSFSMPPEK